MRGNDSNEGSKDYPKATIKNAIENIESGGTIFLIDGIYNESGIVIDKDMNIIGSKTSTTIIDSQKKHTMTIRANVLFRAFTIQNAKNKNDGGAIYNQGNLTLDGIKIKTSSSATFGGAIYNKGKIIAKKSSFSSNNAKYGGAIYSINQLTFNRCTFSNNKAINMGSSIASDSYVYICDCNFTNNKNTPLYLEKTDRLQYINLSSFISNNGVNGGSIYNKNQNLTVEKTYFGNNSASNGGAVYNWGKLYLTNSTFTTNNAQYGGAVYNLDKITILNSKFNSNNAQKGGALFSRTVSPAIVSITGSKFNDNNATIGGAVYVYNQSKLDVKNSSFIANQYNAIYINTNTTNNRIFNSTFIKNVANYGGAIRSAYTNLTLKKNIFNENSAKSAGAIHNYDGNITLNYNSLTNNGGDIYNHGIINADYNWWGSNNIKRFRTVNTKLNNWLYLSVTH